MVENNGDKEVNKDVQSLPFKETIKGKLTKICSEIIEIIGEFIEIVVTYYIVKFCLYLVKIGGIDTPLAYFVIITLVTIKVIRSINIILKYLRETKRIICGSLIVLYN